MQNWWTNAILKEGLNQSYHIVTAMKPIPYEFSVDAWWKSLRDVSNMFTLLIDIVVPLGTSFVLPLLTSTVVM